MIDKDPFENIKCLKQVQLNVISVLHFFYTFLCDKATYFR